MAHRRDEAPRQRSPTPRWWCLSTPAPTLLESARAGPESRTSLELIGSSASSRELVLSLHHLATSIDVSTSHLTERTTFELPQRSFWIRCPSLAPIELAPFENKRAHRSGLSVTSLSEPPPFPPLPLPLVGTHLKWHLLAERVFLEPPSPPCPQSTLVADPVSARMRSPARVLPQPKCRAHRFPPLGGLCSRHVVALPIWLAPPHSHIHERIFDLPPPGPSSQQG